MVEKKSSPPFREKLELLILTESEEALNRAKQVVSRYFLTFRHLSYLKVTQDKVKELGRPHLILVIQEAQEDLRDFSVRVNQVLSWFPRSRLITVMAPSFSRENLEGTYNDRVNAISQSEFYNTLKFEYLCIYRCRSQYYEVQLADFFPMSTMLLSSYMRMEKNQRYLPVIYEDSVLSDERFSRLESLKALYIRAQDSPKYASYVDTYYDSSGAALRKRARALFLAITYYSLYLNESILFDFKSESDAHVEELYGHLCTSAEELFRIIQTGEDLWDVFREAWEDEFSSFWRAPWIAVYGAIISLKSGVGSPLNVFLGALFMDVGLYDLEEDVTRSYLLSEAKKVSEEQRVSFKKHPLLSLNRSLIKNLPLSEEVKAILVCTHEQADEQGFPNQVPRDKLPVEAQILLFAEKIDKEVLTTMKNTGVGFRFLKEKLWDAEKTLNKSFSQEFLESIAESLL